MKEANGGGAHKTIIIKKYANRRLYDTSTSAYVTLDHLSELTRQGQDFIVQDAKTGEDLTRAVLAQIIFEQENKKEGVLPVSFLRQLIQFYGDSVQTMLPAYLELSMKTFNQQQEKWRDYMNTAVGEDKTKAFEEQIRKNMVLFEDTMRLFTPFAPGGHGLAGAGLHTRAEPEAARDAAAGAAAGAGAGAAAGAGAGAAAGLEAIRALQQQMFDMQTQLAQIATGSFHPGRSSKDS